MDDHRELVQRLVNWISDQGAEGATLVQDEDTSMTVEFQWGEKGYSLTINETYR